MSNYTGSYLNIDDGKYTYADFKKLSSIKSLYSIQTPSRNPLLFQYQQRVYSLKDLLLEYSSTTLQIREVIINYNETITKIDDVLYASCTQTKLLSTLKDVLIQIEKDNNSQFNALMNMCKMYNYEMYCSITSTCIPRETQLNDLQFLKGTHSSCTSTKSHDEEMKLQKMLQYMYFEPDQTCYSPSTLESSFPGPYYITNTDLYDYAKGKRKNVVNKVILHNIYSILPYLKGVNQLIYLVEPRTATFIFSNRTTKQLIADSVNIVAEYVVGTYEKLYTPEILKLSELYAEKLYKILKPRYDQKNKEKVSIVDFVSNNGYTNDINDEWSVLPNEQTLIQMSNVPVTHHNTVNSSFIDDATLKELMTMDPEFIKTMDNPSERYLIMAIVCNSQATKHIPNITENIIRAAITQKSELISEIDVSDEMIYNLLIEKIYLRTYFKRKFKDSEWDKKYLTKHPKHIEFIEKTYENLANAIQNDPSVISLLKDVTLANELYEVAIADDYKNIQYVPPQMITSTMINALLNYSLDSINYFPEMSGLLIQTCYAIHGANFMTKVTRRIDSAYAYYYDNMCGDLTSQETRSSCTAVVLRPPTPITNLPPAPIYETIDSKIITDSPIIHESTGEFKRERNKWMTKMKQRDIEFNEVPQQYVDDEMCNVALLLDIKNLHYMSQTDERIKYALSRNPFAIRYVTDQKDRYCNIALNKDVAALQYIRQKKVKHIFKSVMKSPMTVKYLDKVNEDLYIALMAINPDTYHYFNSDCEDYKKVFNLSTMTKYVKMYFEDIDNKSVCK